MIIVYGGTFNPPTRAHEKIANLLIGKYNPNKFIFLPVGDSYTWKENFASFSHRKEMLTLLFNDDIYEISSLDNTKVYKGTYWALNNISKAYKRDVYFVMGADNLDELKKWINYEKLLSEYKFIVLNRKGYDSLKIIKEQHGKYYKNFSVVDFDLDVSSRKFRENPSLKNYLNEKVYDYIKKHNLYEVSNAKV